MKEELDQSIVEELLQEVLSSSPQQHATDHLTDHGNAERCVRDFGHLIRFYKDKKMFVAYNGKYWEEGEDWVKIYFVRSMKKAQAEALALPANTPEAQERRRAVLNHYLRSENAGSVKNALYHLKSLEQIQATVDDFDRHHGMLCVGNGVVDLSTGQLEQYSPKFMITRHVKTKYHSGAQSPTWDNFVNETFLNDQDYIRYVQKCMGCSLLGDVNIESVFLMIGPGGSGKGTFLSAITSAIGGAKGYVMNLPIHVLTRIRDKNGGPDSEIARLKDARIVMAQEVPEDAGINEAVLKSLTGGDIITARFNYQDCFDFQATFTLWISSNYDPIFNSADTGMQRRVKKLYFGNRPAQPNVTLKAELAEESNREGILAWLVEGARLYLVEGLDVPVCVEDWTKRLLEANNPIRDYLAEEYVYDAQLAASHSFKVKHFIENYNQYQVKLGSSARLSRKKIISLLEDAGVQIAKANGQDVLLGYQMNQANQLEEFEAEFGGLLKK